MLVGLDVAGEYAKKMKKELLDDSHTGEGRVFWNSREQIKRQP